jgi:perosamine synthetase
MVRCARNAATLDAQPTQIFYEQKEDSLLATAETHLVLPRVSPMARIYINEVLDYGFHNSTSPGISVRLERDFAAKFGVRYAILHSNGTATMHAALLASGVGAGDEVIVPGLTMASTALVALYVNAIPVFADSDPATFTISVEDVRRKITPRTKAIIPVSIYGLSPDMDAIMALAKEHNLTVIEDNAQCFLGYYHGKVVGSIGDMASFSFQGSKHMTCGDGGILITDNRELADRVRRAAVLGYPTLSGEAGKGMLPEDVRFHPTFARHATIGYNFRMPEIAAAVALADLDRLDQLVEMRQICARFFTEAVRTCRWIVPQETPEGYVNSYWSYAARLTDDGPDWVEFRKKFVELGGDGFYGAWLPVYREPVFQNLSAMVDEKPDRWPQYAGVLPDYRAMRCPVLDAIQPRLVQFKTNYFDTAAACEQAEILARTIRFFS